MKQEVFISIYLDKRRAKTNGKYPVKLRVFTPNPRQQKLFPTIFELTEKEFESSWNTNKPRTEQKELKLQLQAIEIAASKVASKLNPFSFDQFEKQLYRNSGDSVNVQYHFKEVIGELKRREQLGTASSYELSEKSISDFSDTYKKRSYGKLTFFEITKDWLIEYEKYMTTGKGLSLTTVGIYLRNLRALFNRAIEQKELDKDHYPFGKRKYQIPATKNVKKALSKEQLSRLFNAIPQTPEQQKAKDFWFFSYMCNGMNVKDICLLKYTNIQEDRMEFLRAKTRLTTRSNSKQITIFLNHFAIEIIEKYGNPITHSTGYVFDILKDVTELNEEKSKIQNFTRFINQHIKKLCKANELPEEVSTNWARHSFATNSVRKGASLEFMQESLGHNNLKTTQHYFAGFDDENRREFANNLMDFE